jgi:hypothetical protein
MKQEAYINSLESFGFQHSATTHMWPITQLTTYNKIFIIYLK